jgi:hypothetical protein
MGVMDFLRESGPHGDVRRCTTGVWLCGSVFYGPGCNVSSRETVQAVKGWRFLLFFHCFSFCPIFPGIFVASDNQFPHQ